MGVPSFIDFAERQVHFLTALIGKIVLFFVFPHGGHKLQPAVVDVVIHVGLSIIYSFEQVACVQLHEPSCATHVPEPISVRHC